MAAPEAASQILDIGCGKGELLVRAMLSLYNVRFAVNRMEQRHSVSSRGSLLLLLAIAVSIWMTGQLYLLRYYVPSA